MIAVAVKIPNGIKMLDKLFVNWGTNGMCRNKTRARVSKAVHAPPRLLTNPVKVLNGL